MKNRGYKIGKDLTKVKNDLIFKGWEECKAEISMAEYLEVLSAMNTSLPHLYLIIREKQKERDENLST